MSKKDSNKLQDIRKTSSRKTMVHSPSRPSTSKVDSEELYSYTPNWITPQEKAKLKARVKQMKMREQQIMKKEDVVLVRAGKKKSADDDKTFSSEADVEPKVAKSEKSLKSEKSNISEKESRADGKDSKDAMKGERSKDSARSNDSERGKSKNDKGKEELKMSKKHDESQRKHPKEAYANPSGNTLKGKPQREVSTSDLNEHLWATDYANFMPQLYHFKSPEKLSTKNPVLAECPPFWVLLDHTIAVTWKLFSPNADRKDLGIIPLQWSREFVSAMRDDFGEYLSATGQLLSAIEDALIDRYARAADADDKAETEDHDNLCKDDDCKKGKVCKKEHDSLSYVSSESIFKYPVEVSYTLKDIMSRNMPGRMHVESKDGAQSKSNAAVSKIDVPPPDDHESMSRADMLNYLRQLKEEQNLRVEKEKEHAEKIEALIELLAKGKVDGDLWAEGHDHKKKHDKDHAVHFQGKNVDDEYGRVESKDDKAKAKTDKKKGNKTKETEYKDKVGKAEDQKKKKVAVEEDRQNQRDKDIKKRASESSVKSSNENDKSDSD